MTNPFMALSRRIRRTLAERLQRRRVPLVPGYEVTAWDLLHLRTRVLAPNTPAFEYGSWRLRLAPLLPRGWFEQAGLDDVWNRFPGKYDRQLLVAQCLRHVGARRLAGTVAEFGCYRGHTAIQMVHTMAQLGDTAPVLLFDSFAGMPPSDHPGDARWVAGDLTADYEEVQRRFAPYQRVEVVRGFFRDTMPAYASHSFKFAHVDADLYVSIKEVDAWLLPRLVAGGIVIWDDYGFSSCEGARQAVDEDLAGRSDFLALDLPTGQFLAMKV